MQSVLAIALLLVAVPGNMSVFGTSFFGNFMAGWLGSFWSSMDKMYFFLMIATVAALAGVVIAAFNRPLGKILR